MNYQDAKPLPMSVSNTATSGLAAERAAALPDTGIFRILVCRTSHSLGNTLLITPLLREIEATWPGAEIDIVTRNQIADEIFGGYASVRHVVRLPRHGVRHPLQLLRDLRRIRETHYDLAIDPDLRSRSGRALLSLSHARYKIGYAGARDASALTHAIDPQRAPKHAGQFPVDLLRASRRVVCSDYPPLDLRLTRREHEEGEEMLARVLARAPAHKGTIGIFANATGHKLLPSEWWREFLPAVEAHYGADYNLVEIVPASGRSMLDARYPAFYSSSVRKIAKVLSRLSLLITLDCGIMHLARASGTRVAALFTVTNPTEWGPYGEGAHVIDGANLGAAEVAQRMIAAVPANTLIRG